MPDTAPADPHRYRIDAPRHQAGGRYLCRALDTTVGVPRMLKLALTGSGEAELLHQEGVLLSRFEHPNVVGWHDQFHRSAGPERGVRVDGFAMDLIDGVPFGQSPGSLIDRLGRFLQLLSATHYLHRCGYLHLDIKPDNVLVESDRAVLVDLGSACPIKSGPGEGGGTPGYAAPEILLGQAPSIASDMYSLGALLYETLAGRRPWAHADAHLREAVLAGDLKSVRSHNPLISSDLAQLVEAMLSVDARKRPDSIPDIAAAMIDLGAEEQMWAPQSGTPPFVGRQQDVPGLIRLIDGGTGAIVVAGQRGSGRDRLVRAAQRQLTASGTTFVDLTNKDPSGDGPELLEALRRLCAAPWAASVRLGAVYLGDRDTISQATWTEIEEQAAALPPQLRPIWTARDRGASRGLVLEGLGETAFRQLCAHLGVHVADDVKSLQRITGALPGRLLQRILGVARRAGEGISDLHRVLSSLPPGTPEALLSALPPVLQEELEQLVADGLVLSRDGRLFADPLPAAVLRPAEEEVVRTWLHHSGQTAPLWSALTATRIGEWETAGKLLEPAAALAATPMSVRGGIRTTSRVEELAELCEVLVARGHRPAYAHMAHVYRMQGERKKAAALLEPLTDRTEAEEMMFVVILRLLRRFEDVIAICEEWRERSDHPRFITEHLECLRLLYRFDEALRLVDQFEDRLAEVGPFEALKHRARNRGDRLDRGEAKPDATDEAYAQVVWENLYNPEVRRTLFTSIGHYYRNHSEHPERLPRARALYERVIELVDLENDVRNAAGLRLNLSNMLFNDLGQGEEARIVLEKAYQLSAPLNAPLLNFQICYSIFNVCAVAGRWPEAIRWAKRLAELEESITSPRVLKRIDRRAASVYARVALHQKDHARAWELLEGMSLEGIEPSFKSTLCALSARALVGLGRAEDALRFAESREVSKLVYERADHSAAIGRAHLQLARRYLGEARADIPDEVGSGYREMAGRVLLATGGEDSSPAQLAEREADLGRAAQLLQGDRAADALALRHSLSGGSGIAGLEAITELTESIHEPERFPGALARLVTRTLGAHRVLIMLRIPGMGQQISFTELTGAEAAGIGDEVLRRLRTPEDYWLADDAFSDDSLRRSSQTVRTFQLKSLVAVPIVANERAIGALYVDDQHQIGRFGMDDVEMLRRLARAVGGLVPLIKAQQPQLADQPEDLYGLLTSDPRTVSAARHTFSVLQGQPQINLLITGETGTGKSMLARRLATELLGCAGLEEVVLRTGDTNLLVTQLMGSRRGDFTGAVDQEGAIQRALKYNRALFLDEIQNLGEEGQQALLPLLEVTERRFGGLTRSSTQLRDPLHIILATNATTSQGQWAQHFREDLWYRMSATHLHLPPLRERGAEAVYRYLSLILESLESVSPEQLLRPAALAKITSHAWSGNLRQLRAFAVKAAHQYSLENRPIFQQELTELGIKIDHHAPSMGQPAVLSNQQNLQAEQMLSALRQNGWIQRDAAAALGMRPANFSKLLKKFGLRDEVKRQRREHRRTQA